MGQTKTETLDFILQEKKELVFVLEKGRLAISLELWNCKKGVRDDRGGGWGGRKNPVDRRRRYNNL